MNVERIKEGWVSFQRYHCKEGYIDHWIGDSINHPDNEHEASWQLNSFTTYWRCNGGDWVYLPRNEVQDYLDMREEFTAEEIWYEATKIAENQALIDARKVAERNRRKP